MELLSWSSFKTASDAGPSVACHRYQPERRTLIAGLADGHLAYWTRRKDGGSQGSSDAKPFLLHAHAGGVRCVLLVESEGLGLEGCLLFSGGADRATSAAAAASAAAGTHFLLLLLLLLLLLCSSASSAA